MKRDLRKHKYLVGYTGEKQVGYSFENKDRIYLELRTLHHTNSDIKQLLCDDAERAIYELVPIKIIKAKK